MEIVGEDADREEPLGEPEEDGERVVDPGKEDRLIEEDRPGAGQVVDRRRLVRPELRRMVGMDHDHGRKGEAGEDLHQPARHPAREHDRQARVDPDPGHGGDGDNSSEELGETVVVEEERIASGEDHLADRRIGRDRTKRRGRAGRRDPMLGIGELAAEAVAAVDGTGAGRQQERPALVLLHQARRRQRRRLLKRIGHPAGRRGELRPERQDLAEERVVGIPMGHPLEEWTGDKEGKTTGSPAGLGGEGGVEPEEPAELVGIADGGRQLHLPAFPGGTPLAEPLGRRVGRRGRDRLGLRRIERHGGASWPRADG